MTFSAHSLTDKELLRWKETFAKSGIHYDNDDDYREAVHNLVGYFDVLIQMDQEQKISKRLEEKLVKDTEGKS